MKRFACAATAFLVALVMSLTTTTPVGARTPPPVVIGYAVPSYDLTFYVPRALSDDSCHLKTPGQRETACFGYVGLGAHLTGLPKRVYGTGRFLLHWSESFVCVNTTTLVKDPLASRRTTLHGYALTEDPYQSGSGKFTTDTRGDALLPSQKFFAHSPNVNAPQQIGLACGPNELVSRSALVLDKLTLYLYLLGNHNTVIRTYPGIAVPGTYVVPWWGFAGASQG